MSSAEAERLVSLVLHDVAPATQQACQRLIEIAESFGMHVPLTLLVVPRYHGATPIDRHSPFREWIDKRIAAGDELALHGFTHLDDQPTPTNLKGWIARRLLTAGEGEFAALSASAARIRLEAGLALFAACGWKCTGFVPPAWQISAEALGEVAKLREAFLYTSRFSRVTHLPTNENVSIPSICFSARSALRRGLSVAWNDLYIKSLNTAPAIRVALHPADALHESTLAAWRRMMGTILRERTPVTKGALIRSAIRRATTAQ